MRKRIWKKLAAMPCIMALLIGMAAEPSLASEGYITGGGVNLRQGASISAKKIVSLSKNSKIEIIDTAYGDNGSVWYKVNVNGYEGYVSGEYVSASSQNASDMNFEMQIAGFPETYKPGLRELHQKYPNWVFRPQNTGLDWNHALSEEMKGTLSLVRKDAISSWKSTDDGKFDWRTSSWPGFDGAYWVAASNEITAYFMDPRNWLDEDYIFQFESQKYDSAVQNEAGLASMISGTFLEKSVAVSDASLSGDQNTDITSQGADAPAGPYMTGYNDEMFISYIYPDGHTELIPVNTQDASSNSSPAGNVVIAASGPASAGTSASAYTGSGSSQGMAPYSRVIMEAAKRSGTSPYAIASIILQEQGNNGSGRSISGVFSGYEGIYNYFNISSYATNGMGAVEHGLWWASQTGSYGRPWNYVDKAIINGALWYGTNYVNAGQDTLYLKKWNVKGSNLFKHQYMTNVEGAASEGYKLSKAYTGDLRYMTHVFDIPVYENMPASNCPKPTVDGSPNNKLGSLSITGVMFTENFDMDKENYSVYIPSTWEYVQVNATALHGMASVTGTGIIPLTDMTCTIPVYVTAENGSVRTYTVTVVKT